MAFISSSRHREFLEVLDQSIRRFEEFANEEKENTTHAILSRLRNEKDLLQDLFTECDHKTQQLRRLIARYQDTQRKARVELRVYRQRFGYR